MGDMNLYGLAQRPNSNLCTKTTAAAFSFITTGISQIIVSILLLIMVQTTQTLEASSTPFSTSKPLPTDHFSNWNSTAHDISTVKSPIHGNQSNGMCSVSTYFNCSDYGGQLTKPSISKECELQEYYEQFESLLHRFDCDVKERDILRYSSKSDCSQCKEMYKKWLCATESTYIGGNHTNIPMCVSVCHAVVRHCPYIHPGGDEDYSSDPSFLCNDGTLQGESQSTGQGTKCFYFSDESWEDDNCGNNGLCVNNSSASLRHHISYLILLVFSLASSIT